MRLVTFGGEAGLRLGALVGDEQVVDLQRADQALIDARQEEPGPLPIEMLRFLQLGDAGIDRARRALEYALSRGDAIGGVILRRDAIRLAAPVPRPGKLVCVRLNYPNRRAEMGRAVLEWPAVFSKFPSTVIGPDDPIVRPAQTQQLDFEGELAVIIGRPGKHIPEEAAYDYVAGYTLFNDVTARDILSRYQVTLGKNFDTFAPLGPFLATRDEIPDPHDLHLVTRLNERTMQQSSTGEMIFNVPKLIAFFSDMFTLEPGDVIATGTPEGVGRSHQPPVFLQPGDRIEISIETLGVLSNPIQDEMGARP